MPSIIEGYNYDIRLRLSYGGHVFISCRQKKNECERARKGEGESCNFEK